MTAPDAKMRFKNIEVMSLHMAIKPTNWVDGNPYEFDIKLDSQVNPDHKLLIIISDITIREHKSPNVLSTIKVACIFEIENFSEAIIQSKDGVFQIPIHVDVILKTMSLSTVRGIMFSEFRGTYLYEAILPMIIIPASEIKPKKEGDTKLNS